MLKKFFVKMLFAAVFLALFSIKYVDVTIGEHIYEEPLEIAWKAIGLPLKEVSTESWMQLNKRWMTVYELRNLAEEIKNKLNLKLKTKITCGEQDGITYASMEGTLKDKTVVTVTIQSNRSDYKIETQMGVNTSKIGRIENMRSYLRTLKSRVLELAKEPHFKVLLIGEHKGIIRSDVVREISGRAFLKIQAELIDSAYEAGNSWQKGYSKLIDDSIKFNLKKMNVEIGTRYDRGQNITQVVLASPSLGEEL